MYIIKKIHVYADIKKDIKKIEINKGCVYIYTMQALCSFLVTKFNCMKLF